MRVQELADRIERAQSDPKALALVRTDAINEARADLVAEAVLARELGELRNAVERELGALRGIMERELASLRSEMTQEFKLVRAEMAALDQQQSARLEKALRDQTRWFGGIVIAAIGVLGAILKLL